MRARHFADGRRARAADAVLRSFRFAAGWCGSRALAVLRGDRSVAFGRWVAVAVMVLWAGLAQAREPRGSAVEEPAAAVASGLCQARVVAELRRGEVSAEPGCEVARSMAQRRQHQLARWHHGFGLLERATVGLGDVSLLLSEARGCELWPLRTAGRESLGLYDVQKAGCWVRRYNGTLTVSGVLADGRKVSGVTVLRVREGLTTIDLVSLVATLERRGLGPDAFVRLELGAHGWAGSVDLVATRVRLADWHAASVQRGRGVAALVPVRHPAHPAADQVRALALETTLARQAADFAAVQRGELAPYRFLERHAWSPYRGQVAAMGGVP